MDRLNTISTKAWEFSWYANNNGDFTTTPGYAQVLETSYGLAKKKIINEIDNDDDNDTDANVPAVDDDDRGSK